MTDDLDLGTKGKVLPEVIHVQYESSITYHSEVMVNVKVFCSQTEK